MKELYKKNKILFIASFCVVIGIIAFFAVHGVVYNIVSNENTQSMNEQLAGKTFVFYRDDQIWVAKMNDDGTYIQKRYQQSDDGVVSLVATDGEQKLDYSYTFWGDLFLPGSELDAAGNVVKFGADGYTLATQEELSLIQSAEERALTKCTLSDFMMSMDEYRAAYKASGMPVSDELIDLDMGETCILYKDDSTGTYVMAVNNMPEKNTFRVISDSLNGKSRGYDYMMRPILLYLKDIPGALTDVHEIIDRWDAVENTGTLGNEVVAEFTHNGITYYRSEDSSRIYVEIKVDKYHEVYLADYPEFMSESNTQPSDDIDTGNDAPEPSQSIQDTEDNNANNANTNSDSGKNNSAGNSNSNVTSNPCATGHDWVAITKTVHHDAVGHYETVQDAKKVIKYQCAVCYNSFNSLDEYYSHFDQAHGYDNNLVATFRERYEKVEDWEYYDTQKWVVDQEAYDETVITGYKCSVCGTTK